MPDSWWASNHLTSHTRGGRHKDTITTQEETEWLWGLARRPTTYCFNNEHSLDDWLTSHNSMQLIVQVPDPAEETTRPLY